LVSTASDYSQQLEELNCALAKAARNLLGGMNCEILSTGRWEISLLFSCQHEPGGPLTHWRAVMPAPWGIQDELLKSPTMDPTKS